MLLIQAILDKSTWKKIRPFSNAVIKKTIPQIKPEVFSSNYFEGTIPVPKPTIICCFVRHVKPRALLAFNPLYSLYLVIHEVIQNISPI